MLLFSIISLTMASVWDNILEKSWEQIEQQLVNGSLPNGHLSVADVELLMSSLNPRLVGSDVIGSTFQNNSIRAYYISHELEQHKPAILITSLHHAREIVSLQMNVYLFLKFLHEVENRKNPQYIYLAKTCMIWMVPFVNLDGYKVIENQLQSGVKYPLIRKNLNNTDQSCMGNTYGVDLNRNYAYKFNLDQQGGSNDKCDETYRGAAPFSEKETQAIKAVIEQNTFLLAMNLHSFGDLWIVPYSYGDIKLDENSTASRVYQDFQKNAKFAPNSKFGHAQELVEYPVNGEAADWMLHEQKIIAISPELGRQFNFDDFTANFYPPKETTLETFQLEFQPLSYFINLLPFTPIILSHNAITLKQEHDIYQEFEVINNRYLKIIQITYSNRGVSPSQQDLSVKFVQKSETDNFVVRYAYIATWFEIEQESEELTELVVLDGQIIMGEIVKAREHFRLFVTLDYTSCVLNNTNVFKTEVDVKIIYKKELEIASDSFTIETTINKNQTEYVPSDEDQIPVWILYGGVSVASALLLLSLVWLLKRRSLFVKERDRQQLFKQNISKIFKVEGEF